MFATTASALNGVPSSEVQTHGRSSWALPATDSAHGGVDAAFGQLIGRGGRPEDAFDMGPVGGNGDARHALAAVRERCEHHSSLAMHARQVAELPVREPPGHADRAPRGGGGT